jgi:hypothetical protein
MYSIDAEKFYMKYTDDEEGLYLDLEITDKLENGS